jgi:cation-transporting ATPase E
VGSATLDEARSAATLALVLFAFWLLLVLMRPVDAFDAGLLAGLGGLFVAVLAIDPVRDFYRFEWPPVRVLVAAAAVVVAGMFASSAAMSALRTRRP